jgi:hypothetical protein
MNQLPDSVKALAIDIRKSYEDLLLEKTSIENDKKIVMSPTIKSENEDEYDQEFGPDKESIEEKISTKKIDKFSELNDDIFSWNEERAVKRVLELRYTTLCIHMYINASRCVYLYRNVCCISICE